MNRNRKRVMAGAMAVVMTAGAVGVYEYQSPESTVMAEEETKEALKDAANMVLEGNEDTKSKEGAENTESIFKEESVYVKADPDGKVSNTTVTEWIKNPENGEFADTSNLKDIKNIKGEEEYTKGSKEDLKWKSEGNDIYYQGTTDEKLPVDVNISYKLNGKDVKAEDLAGKNGKVEIYGVCGNRRLLEKISL